MHVLTPKQNPSKCASNGEGFPCDMPSFIWVELRLCVVFELSLHEECEDADEE